MHPRDFFNHHRSDHQVKAPPICMKHVMHASIAHTAAVHTGTDPCMQLTYA